MNEGPKIDLLARIFPKKQITVISSKGAKAKNH